MLVILVRGYRTSINADIMVTTLALIPRPTRKEGDEIPLKYNKGSPLGVSIVQIEIVDSGIVYG